MTRDELVAAAQQLYNEETGDFVSLTFFQTRLNEIKRRVEVRTRVYRVSSTQNLPNSRTVIVPAGWFAFRRKGGVLVANYGEVTPVSIEEVKARYPQTWETDTSTYPVYWYVDDAMKSDGGTPAVYNVALGFYPTPSAAITNGLRLSGYGLSADFTVGAVGGNGFNVSPYWPTPYHMTLVWGMCWAASVRESDPELREARKVGMWASEFERAILEMKDGASDFHLLGSGVEMGSGVGGGPETDEDGVVWVTQVTV